MSGTVGVTGLLEVWLVGVVALARKSADSALSLLGGVVAPPSPLGLREMVMFSGPLESELPRINIFW